MKEGTIARRELLWAGFYTALIAFRAPVWIALVALGISLLYYILVIISEQLAYLPRSSRGSKSPETKAKKDVS